MLKNSFFITVFLLGMCWGVIAHAGEPTTASIAFFTGMDLPELSLDYGWICKGSNDKTGSFGGGFVYTNSTARISARATFGYKLVSVMKYTSIFVDNKRMEYITIQPRFRYSLCRFAVSFLKPIVKSKSFGSLYVGCGSAMDMLVFHTESGYITGNTLFGFSGFPLVGVEAFQDRRFKMFGELQYHLGQTVKSSSSPFEYRYSLNGPSIILGVRI
jgi:hypothetical protein